VLVVDIIPGVLLFGFYSSKQTNKQTNEMLSLVEIELYPRQSCLQHENHLESTPIPAKVGIVHKLTGWFSFQDQYFTLISLNTPSPTPDVLKATE